MAKGYKWYNIPNFPHYKINKIGDVVSMKFNKNKILSRINDKDGYQIVVLCNFGKVSHFRLHRLVGYVFIENKDNLPEINHKDGNKKNNYYKNLAWITRRDNIIHSLLTGLKPYGSVKQKNAVSLNNIKKRKIVYKYSLLNEFICEYNSLSCASHITSIDLSNISSCCNGKVKTAGGFIWSYIKY